MKSILLLLLFPLACLAQTTGIHAAPAAPQQQTVDAAEVQKRIDHYLSLDDFEHAAAIAVTKAHYDSIRAAKKAFGDERKERKKQSQDAKEAARCSSPASRAGGQTTSAPCAKAVDTAVAPGSSKPSN